MNRCIYLFGLKMRVKQGHLLLKSYSNYDKVIAIKKSLPCIDGRLL